MEGECRLVRPDGSMLDEIMSYKEEFERANDSMDGTGALRRCRTAQEWLENARRMENPETVPDGKVSATQYVLLRESDRRIVGMIQLRHDLNPYLRQFSGHVGYSVRPSERRRGYAGTMLTALLSVCRQRGMERVLITCFDANEASRRVILKHGGVYEGASREPTLEKNIERYWITL